MELFNTAIGKNITIVRPPYFIISGFTGIPNIKYYYAFLFFLRTPKYIAVFNLAFADLVNSSALVPKVFDVFLFDHPYIPYNDCLTSMFFWYTCGAIQALNLVALSYDRLIAISFPLHYHVKVTHRFMFSFITFAWLLVITIVVTGVSHFTRLSFCKSVVINSYFCDYDLVQNLACNDYTFTWAVGHLISALILWLPLLFILSCYSYIGYALSNVATVKERVKAFKTCSSHLSLVAIYFLPILITLTMTDSIHPNARIINMSLTAIFPPMLNPIIYVLQTQEINIKTPPKKQNKRKTKTKGRLKTGNKLLTTQPTKKYINR
uniref:G-protein coupled receptors family 1 profile domain-containing protein n=1 Tax=Monopterus albus TaxID=43700 RepID=A0A3Q3K4M4_MONAL